MAIEMKSLQVNGVKIPVVFERNTRLPLFYVQLVFKGAGGVSNGKNLGLADITSTLLNEGTKSLGVTKFSAKLEEKALSLSVGSGLETLSFTLSGMQSMQKDGIGFLKDLLQNPNFTQVALDKVKENALIAILEKESDYDYQANRLLQSLLFKGTALEYPLNGTQDSIAKISLNDVEKFYKSYVNLESLILVVGGDVEFSVISKELEGALSKLPKGKKQEITKREANDSKAYKRMLKDTQQAYIYFGAPLKVENLQKELAYIKVASFVLGGGGFGSRMMEEVRVKRGLAYSAVMRLSATNRQFCALGYLQTSLKNEREAQKIVVEVVNDFVKNGITQEELDEAKRYLLGSEPLRNETLSQRLSTAYMNYYDGLPLDFNTQVLKEISALKLSDVNAYIKAHSEIKDLTFAVVSADTDK
ncbi:M16 family metallopeptidase [Helicobacter turcicus]|uniref:Insulinase family protein n=1 Tax=Helicobacter turcicus TaxID=2867412 RepID=A0ABS7JM00_9HELI|nr:pitrilysin family protein [Helicobacter turcicus]MBX7490419.1 insulinase family protein [Helicobacter turcicus]MBX7545277.1 insulinase family protein [Helicobacter turcicus]